MAKKVYRSLFDSDDVYDVDELTDNPDISTSGVAAVKAEDAGEPGVGAHTVEECWDAIQEIRDMLKKGVKDGNEPAAENKVEPLNVEIDNAKQVNAQDDDGEEDNKEVGASKGVKDAYSSFTRVGEKKVVDVATATQVAFQSRYDGVGNK